MHARTPATSKSDKIEMNAGNSSRGWLCAVPFSEWSVFHSRIYCACSSKPAFQASRQHEHHVKGATARQIEDAVFEFPPGKAGYVQLCHPHGNKQNSIFRERSLGLLLIAVSRERFMWDELNTPEPVPKCLIPPGKPNAHLPPGPGALPMEAKALRWPPCAGGSFC